MSWALSKLWSSEFDARGTGGPTRYSSHQYDFVKKPVTDILQLGKISISLSNNCILGIVNPWPQRPRAWAYLEPVNEAFVNAFIIRPTIIQQRLHSVVPLASREWAKKVLHSLESTSWQSNPSITFHRRPKVHPIEQKSLVPYYYKVNLNFTVGISWVLSILILVPDELHWLIYPQDEAVIPLSAHSEDNSLYANITGHYPQAEEAVTVSVISQTVTQNRSPEIEFSAASATVKASGVGSTTTSEGTKVIRTFLTPKLSRIGNDPLCLVW